MRSMSSRLSRWFLPRFPGVIMSIMCYNVLFAQGREMAGWRDSSAVREAGHPRVDAARRFAHQRGAAIAAHHSEEYRGMPGYPWAIHGLSMLEKPFYNQIMHQKVTASLCFNRFVMFTDSVENWSGNRNPLPLTPARFSASFIKAVPNLLCDWWPLRGSQQTRTGIFSQFSWPKNVPRTQRIRNWLTGWPSRFFFLLELWPCQGCTISTRCMWKWWTRRRSEGQVSASRFQ